MGPRPGEPVCPCMMRGMKKENGRWVKKIDYGPIRDYGVGYESGWYERGCLNEAYDNALPDYRKGEPRMLSCPCPKCSTYC